MYLFFIYRLMKISVFLSLPEKEMQSIYSEGLIGWNISNHKPIFTGLVDLREKGISFLCRVRYLDCSGQHGFPQGSLASSQSENKQISLTVITVPLI